MQVVVGDGPSLAICLVCSGTGAFHVSAKIPKPTLSSVVGSLCLQSGEKALNSLATYADLVLDPESRNSLRQSKRLGKVNVALKVDQKGDANLLVHKSSEVIWDPAVSQDVESIEEKLSGIVSAEGKMNAKIKAAFLNTVSSAVDLCKKRRVSLASDVSGKTLIKLIGT